MREYEVDSQTFDQALPPIGARLVVEIERTSFRHSNPLKIYTHRSECVTGIFLHLKSIPVQGKVWRKATIQRKSGGIQQVETSSRWYIQGSARLKAKGASR